MSTCTREDTYPPTLRIGHEDRFARFLALQYANDPVSMAATLRMIAITEWASTWPTIQCPAWFVAVSHYKARPIESVRVHGIGRSTRSLRGAGDRSHSYRCSRPSSCFPLLRTFLEATGR